MTIELVALVWFVTLGPLLLAYSEHRGWIRFERR
jgi:hypothetical protein